MGFVDENLMPNESVVYRTKLHKIVFVAPLFFALPSILRGVGSNEDSGLVVGSVAMLIILAVLGGLAYATSEFAVTNRRVIIKRGIIMRETIEILLPKIESVSVRVGILGRIFGYGTVIVTGTGGSPAKFGWIANAIELRRRIVEQIESSRQPT